MRWRDLALAVAFAVAVSGCGAAPAEGASGRRADIEFTLTATAPEQREEIALTLWKTGAVARVTASEGSSSSYRVYLKDPGNLILMAHVHDLLKDRSGVVGVSSLAGYMGASTE